MKTGFPFQRGLMLKALLEWRWLHRFQETYNERAGHRPTTGEYVPQRIDYQDNFIKRPTGERRRYNQNEKPTQIKNNQPHHEYQNSALLRQAIIGLARNSGPRVDLPIFSGKDDESIMDHFQKLHHLARFNAWTTRKLIHAFPLTFKGRASTF